jgi:hypothetical protein
MQVTATPALGAVIEQVAPALSVSGPQVIEQL